MRAYHYGLYLSVSSLVVTGMLVSQLNSAPSFPGISRGSLLLSLYSAIAAVCLSVASLLLPRRPDVFVEGRLVDRMFTVNAFSRLTFGWAWGLMSLATKKGDLDLADLPRLGHRLRPDYQTTQWKSARRREESLFRSVLRIYGWSVFKQWTAAITNTAISYLPWWITLRLLETLESRKPGEPVGQRLWVFLVLLGVTKITNAVRNQTHLACTARTECGC